MNTPGPSRFAQWLIWSLLTLTIVSVAGVYWRSRQAMANRLPILFTVPEFSLTNQNGAVVGLNQLKGAPWVADIVFTRCAGPCPEMTRRMQSIQEALPAGSPVKLVSLTTDPTFDSPAVLKKYAQRFGAKDRWHFLTGTKAQIVAIAGAEGLKFTAVEKEPAKRESETDLFIHSTIMVLIDRQGRARGVFETMEEGFKESLLRAVESLSREP